MTEQEALAKMVAPGTHRPEKYGASRGFGGVMQIHVTRACDRACFNCTQGSNLAGKPTFMTPEQFELAVKSLEGYPGIIGVFGGNPAMSPHFEEYCKILQRLVPYHRRGLWCNHPRGKGKIMAVTFDPAVSNLNVHLDREAYNEFRRDWPGCRPVGLNEDSRHSPVFVAMKDVLKKPCDCQRTKWDHTCPDCNGTREVYDESTAWELISNCDINKHWSAMIGVFRGELRAWFCEIAGAQSILHQDDPEYPDTGVPIKYWPADKMKQAKETHKEIGMPDITIPPGSVFSGHFPINEPAIQPWWKLPMAGFADQVRKHCHECSVPLRGFGEMACATDGTEQVSKTHEAIYKPKRPGRKVEVVQELYQIKPQTLGRFTHYLQNSKAKNPG